MSDPIVSPWLIYLLGQIDGWQMFLAVTAGVGGVLLGFTLIFWFVTGADQYMEDERKVAGSAIKLLAPFVLPIAFFALICPSRDTVIAVCVAKNVTPSNIAKAVDAGKDIKDELVADIVAIIHGEADEKE